MASAMETAIDIETKDYIIDCVLSGKHNAEVPSVDIMIDLNHMCRQVNRWYVKTKGYKKYTYPVFDYRLNINAHTEGD